MRKNVISVIDGMAGSCGKAKVIGELATDKSLPLGAAVTNCMPNAGHTFISEKGEKLVFRNIPTSIVNPKTELFIGPGSAIDMEIFAQEYDKVKHLLNGRKIYVHEMVPLIEERHKVYEREHLKSGSTFKGCGAVTMEKVMRDERLKFFKTYLDAVVCSNDEWMDRLYEHIENPDEYIMLEGAQGCDLSLNHSGNYPYVTSRNVSTSQLLADSGISPERLLETIMVIRPYPIRISNITKSGDYIYSGGMGKGEEFTWTQINLAAQNESYPFKGDIESGWYDFISLLDEKRDYIKEIYNLLPDYFKMQLFKANYLFPSLENVSLLKALEIERLYHKSKGENAYLSEIISDGYDGYPMEDLSEQTTVTKMERRIFDIDIRKLKNNIRINTPYGIYLNFFQHLDSSVSGRTGNFEDFCYNEATIERYFDWLEEETNREILALGTGARNNERIIKRSLIRR